jgi:hypothetical protein
MDQKEKIILSEMQINNLIELTKDLQYQAFIKSHLLPVKYELQRQMHLLTASKEYSKIQ